MTADMFGFPARTKEITCAVFHDDRTIAGKWLYHGFLFVPLDKIEELSSMLLHSRIESTWQKELHFVALDNTRTMNELALKWISLFCNELIDFQYFYLFGIDLTRLTKELWERATRDFKIFNRFFQIGLYSAIKWFFLNETAKYDKVVIDSLFSDSKTRTPEDKFHSQPIQEIEFKAFLKDEPIIFNSPAVIDINSDHEEEKSNIKESHIIQYVDILIGAFSQTMDFSSKHFGKCKCAEALLKKELPTILMKYDGPHIKSFYYKKYGISFFPRYKLSKADILNSSIHAIKNQFFSERELTYLNRNQLRLL